MNQEKNELSVFETEKEVFCSMPTKSVEDRKAVAKALEQSDVLLNDCVGQKFELKGIYTEKKMIQKMNDKKELELDEHGNVIMIPKYRTILFAEDGKTYATGAYGVYSSIKSLIYVYGTPDQWDAPVSVTVIKQKLKDGKTTLKLDY